MPIAQTLPKVASEAYHDILLTITKASLQPDGSIRWQAVTSDTEPDKAKERTSTALFDDWIDRITYDIKTDFLPDSPRMPFLGVSHYPSLDGLGEAGPTRRMYTDGDKFKADGIFYTDGAHPVGPQLLETIKSELALIRKGEQIERPVRISAAWWDIEHLHGDSDFTFTRRSLLDKCPLCTQGQTADKIYLKGQLDHFAATRAPMNPRTSIELEEKSMAKITRKEDASSIIDPELAEQLEEQARLIGKAETDDGPDELPEAMVVRNDEAETTKAMMKTVDGEKRPMGDFLVVEDEKSPSTWHLPVRVNGKVDRRLMGAAWAALHEGSRGNKYEGPNKAKALAALKKLYAQEEMPTPGEKAETEKMDDDEMERKPMMRPLGGAVSLDEAETFVETQRKMGQLYSNWDMFQAVMRNIMSADEEAVPDKIAAMSEAVSGLGTRIDALKAGLADAFLVQDADYTEDEDENDYELEAEDAPDEVEVAPLENNTNLGEIMTTQAENPADILRAQVEAALTGQSGRADREKAIQTALNSYADTVKAQLDRVAPPDPAQLMAETLKGAFAETLTPLVEQMSLLNAKMSQPQAQAQHQPYQQTTLSLPQQKSMTYQPSQLDTPPGQMRVSSVTGKPSQLADYCYRSVGGQ